MLAPCARLAVLVAACVAPQLAQQNNTAPSIVVSIKPSDAGNDPGGFRMTGGTFIAHRVNVKLLVAIAYGVQPYQVSGGPGWIDTERFDVEAKPDGPDNPDRDESAMVKALLADRFKLVLHKDENQTSAFARVIAEKGPRMKLSTDQSPGTGPLSGVHVSPGNLVGHGMRLGLVASLLGTRLGRPVVDRTNLPDRYDIDLTWSPDVGELPAGVTDTPPQPDPSHPSLFTAIQQQLGLKLDSIKAPSGFFVIDTIERPVAN